MTVLCPFPIKHFIARVYKCQHCIDALFLVWGLTEVWGLMLGCLVFFPGIYLWLQTEINFVICPACEVVQQLWNNFVSHSSDHVELQCFQSEHFTGY